MSRPLSVMPPRPARSGSDDALLSFITREGGPAGLGGPRAPSAWPPAERAGAGGRTGAERAGHDLLPDVSVIVRYLTEARTPLPVCELAEKCRLGFVRVVELVTLLDQGQVVVVSGEPGHETVSLRR